MRYSILCAAVLCGSLAAEAISAELNTKDVAADAKWVAHVDVDALRASNAGKYLHEKWMAKEDAQKKLKKIQEDTGVDLTKDLHGVTLYDNRFVEHSGVVVMHASNLDQDKLVAALKAKHADCKTDKHGEHTVYSWTEKHGKDEHVMNGTFFGQDRMLLSHSAKQLAAVLDVLDGKSPSLPASSPLAETPAKGTFFLARGIDMQGQPTPFHLEAVRHAKSLSMTAGQQDKELFMETTLSAPDAKSAMQIGQAVEGLRAVMQLILSEDKSAEAVLRGLKADVAEEKVVVKWRAAGADVAQLIAEEHARKEKRRTERKHDSDEKSSPHRAEKKRVPAGDD